MLPPGRPSIINVDDPRGATLVETVERPVTYAVRADADVTSGPIDASLAGLQFDVHAPRGALRVRSALIGRANASNILAAIAAGIALDLPFRAIEAGVADVQAVPGRFETVSTPSDDLTVVVDFAHTDDALRILLEAARPLAKGRLITVFGCGGDRDRSKRPLMGAVAARLSDLVIVTSDNPRSEDPDAIIAEVVSGIEPRGDWLDAPSAPARADEGRTPFRTIVDRAEAIEYAVREARVEDLVILAGKGHEASQIIGRDTVAFDDAEMVRAALVRRRSKSSVP
jgi:UDP-N-acetylmuramoyl-L-alanyl-D-glutamate--2,6-diaminopimelate ligase